VEHEQVTPVRALAFATLLLAACPKGDAPPGPPDLTAAPLHGAILLGDSATALESGMGTTKFNFVRLRDLFVRVTVPALTGLAVMKLTFFTPGGEILYETSAPFSTDPAQTSAMMGPMPHPSTVFLAKPVPGGYALDREIAIAGSVFTRDPRPGVWRVTASVEGVPGTLSTMIEVIFSR
jgi:hypothetical protein